MEIFGENGSGDGQDSQEREMLATFLQELSENVLKIETALIELEKSPSDKDQINSLFRLFHNLKGSSAMMSMPILMDVAHWSESVLDLARNERLKLSTGDIDLLLESLSAIRDTHGNLKANGKEGTKRHFHLLAKLSDVIDAQSTNGTVVAAPEAEHAATEASAKESARTQGDDLIKVSRTLIDQMMLLVGDFMLLKNRFDWLGARYSNDAELFDNCRELEVFSSKLQRTVLKLRLSPVSPLFSSMHRVVRSTCAEIGKKVQFDVHGGETLLDRTILDVLGEPLMHLLRNSIDHGIEKPEAREAANKPAEGQVILRAQYRSGEIYISVTDDGKGIDAERIKAKAVERGFVTAAQAQVMTINEALNLIFLPGFSSNEVVTQVSGRGVGMDVVKSAVEAVGGQVEIQTELGVGTTFNLRLPLSLAIIDCLGFTVGNQACAIAQVNVEEVYSAFSSVVEQNLTKVNGGGRVLVVRDVPVPVIPLSDVFEVESAGAQAYVLVRHGKSRFVLEVDQITGPLSIVSQGLPSAYAGRVPLAGVTKQGDGSLLFQVDVGRLATLVHHNPVHTAKRNTYITTDGKTATAAMLTSSDIRRLQQKIITFRNIQGFCLPVQRAKRIVHMERCEIKEVGDSRMSYVTVDGQTIPLVWVEEILLKSKRIDRESYSVVLFQIQEQVYGLPLVDFCGIKRMPENYDQSLADVGISGSTVIDGETFILLDLHGLVDKHKKKPADADATKKSNVYRILAAEDDGFFATEMIASLRGAGFEVVHFKDGLLAKLALEDATFAKTIDLVVTDIEMPNLNGLGLLRWIKACSHTRHLPCIAYTAITTADMRAKTAQAGALVMVSKMSTEQLIDEINRVRRGELTAAAADAAARAEAAQTAVSRYVTFTLSGDWFALPMDSIKEVSPRTPSAPIPSAPKAMCEVTFFRGQVIPIIDLAALFGLESDADGAREQAVAECEGVAFALLLGRVGEVLPSTAMTQGEGLPRITAGGEKIANFVRTSFTCGDRVMTLFDISALASLAKTGDAERQQKDGKVA